MLFLRWKVLFLKLIILVKSVAVLFLSYELQDPKEVMSWCLCCPTAFVWLKTNNEVEIPLSARSGYCHCLHFFLLCVSVLCDGLRSSLKDGSFIPFLGDLSIGDRDTAWEWTSSWERIRKARQVSKPYERMLTVNETVFPRNSLPFPALTARGQFWKEHPNITSIQLL